LLLPVTAATNPFPARLITKPQTQRPGSAKDTRHFEISLEGSGLTYEVATRSA